ncbi:hypothetical protein PRZ48_006428 [Zasmidium cellare]|uniref:Uncharacterized protein n=1 Tax=Zasmidium cellare TaxID=395010 RepID=A0ABR0EPD3_ZASCE|nr:hypothetical protein PRZ48_006428 [Zasmidium cellare]
MNAVPNFALVSLASLAAAFMMTCNCTSRARVLLPLHFTAQAISPLHRRLILHFHNDLHATTFIINHPDRPAHTTGLQDNAVNPLANMAVSKPIINLPLPQELKDEIWSYFLDGEVVQQTCRRKYQPAGHFSTKDTRNFDWPHPEHGCLELLKGTKPRPYNFQLSISSINKAIRGDTLNFLAQRNTFVLVRYNCPALRAYLEQLHVPIVAHDGLQYFSCHNLEINIDWKYPSFQAPSVYSPPNPPRSLLMLEKDLGNFWLVLRLLCQKIKPSVVVFDALPGRVSSIYNVRYEELDEWVGVPAVTVSGRSAEYRELMPKMDRHFLDQIESVVGLGYNIRFHGLEVEPPRLFQLQKVIAPSIICSTARETFHLDTLVQIKKQADILAVAGDHEAAEVIFGCIETASYSETRDADSEYKQVLDRLRRRASELAFSFNSRARSAMPQNATGTAFDNFQHTEHVIHAIHLMRMGPIVLPFWTNSPATLLADMEGLTENERVLHDVLWLRHMLSQPTLSPDMIRAEDTSVYKFPFPVFDSGPMPSLKNIVGWQDMKQLGKLSSRQKEAVHALQKQHRLPLSDL